MISYKNLLEFSKKNKPNHNCPDYFIKENCLYGWAGFKPSRKKPKKPYFKVHCWYYEMALLRGIDSNPKGG